jgi:hypothetical protein
MEWWKKGIMGRKTKYLNPSFHDSNLPAFQFVSDCDLCVLCLLFVHPLVFNPGGWKGK